MKIWQVTESDKQMRFYWFETKKEAESHAKHYREESIRDGGHYSVDVQSIKFDATRKGLVEALNHVINLTCFNEG